MSHPNHDPNDPFRRDYREDFSLISPEEARQMSVSDEVEAIGLKKRCVDCETLMDQVRATEAQVFGNPELDNTTEQLWAVCGSCHRILRVVLPEPEG